MQNDSIVLLSFSASEHSFKLVGALKMCTYGAVQTQSEEHDEEEYGPDGAPGKCGDGLRVDLEHETVSLGGYLLDGHALLGGHVAQIHEDHEAAVEAREAVHRRRHQAVPAEKVPS